MNFISQGKLVLAASLLSCAATGAGATTVMNFDSLRAADPTDYTYVTGPYKEAGFTLTSSLCQGPNNSGCFIGVQRFKSMDKVGAAIATQYVSPKVTLTRDSGAAFLLQSIDFSEYFDNLIYAPFTTDVIFSYVFADGSTGTTTRTFSNDGAYLPTTFSFSLAPLRSFSWTPVTGGGVQFDNIVLNDVAAVPEPATWGMMLLGFGMIGSAVRRRKATAGVRFA
ncbi:hypothetical protein ASG11_09480 [Sphingomonas sp. Leaf357]|uniref:PEPxxWA-CTERM sorting domain-containing protein n=1 Tax=Sphingomonas sp. Leaf357 TaxID=1736350 RepID=UPI0006FCE441|nr:PEPxxWA-CTERM sorting domain-containing protein [Sphingomonas sp. Leaf357]KQS04452.1 hypothetical protein ASG11_09480 [Sphingomonas sp. Leaf357]